MLFVATPPLRAQYLFNLTIRGSAYQRSASGNLVPVPITNETLLREAAQYAGLPSTKGLALVYHIQGSDYGDTIDAVNRTNGLTYTTVFGFFFGDDPSLNREAITNSVGTQVRRIDYIYTHQNSHSMGSGFVTKRLMNDRRGNLRGSIDAKMQWITRPEGDSGTQINTATFSTTTLFKPLQ